MTSFQAKTTIFSSMFKKVWMNPPKPNFSKFFSIEWLQKNVGVNLFQSLKLWIIKAKKQKNRPLKDTKKSMKTKSWFYYVNNQKTKQKFID